MNRHFGIKQPVRKKPKKFKTFVFIAFRDPCYNTPLFDVSFYAQKTTVFDAILQIVHQYREQAIVRTKGQSSGMHNYDVEDFELAQAYPSASVPDSYAFDSNAPLELELPLRDQITIPCVLALFVRPDVAQDRELEAMRIARELHLQEEQERKVRELKEKRDANVRAINERYAQMDAQSKEHSYQREEALQKQIQYEKETTVPPDVRLERCLEHKRELQRIKNKEMEAERESNLMFLHDLEARAREERVRQYAIYQAKEAHKQRIIAAENQRLAYLRAQEKEAQRQIGRIKTLRGLEQNLDLAIRESVEIREREEDEKAQRQANLLGLESAHRQAETKRLEYDARNWKLQDSRKLVSYPPLVMMTEDELERQVRRAGALSADELYHLKHAGKIAESAATHLRTLVEPSFPSTMPAQMAYYLAPCLTPAYPPTTVARHSSMPGTSSGTPYTSTMTSQGRTPQPSRASPYSSTRHVSPHMITGANSHLLNGISAMPGNGTRSETFSELTSGRPPPYPPSMAPKSFSFNPRFPPLHKLPPVTIPDGAYVELGQPVNFVKFYGPLFKGVKYSTNDLLMGDPVIPEDPEEEKGRRRASSMQGSEDQDSNGNDDEYDD